MNAVTTDTRPVTNAAIRLAVQFFVDRGMTRTAVAKQIGYKSDDSIRQVFSDEYRALDTESTLNLLRACAERGYFTPICMRILGSDQMVVGAERVETNECVTDDFCEALDAWTDGRRAFDGGDVLTARQRFERALHENYEALAECDAQLAWIEPRVPLNQIQLSFAGDGR